MSLKRKQTQISKLSLTNWGKDIRVVTMQTRGMRGCKFGKHVSHWICISTNPRKITEMKA